MEKTIAKNKRELTGKVVSTGMNKTIVVEVSDMRMNEKYQKKYRVSKKYHVHCENSKVKVDDVVHFVECRPMSKTVRWVLAEPIKK